MAVTSGSPVGVRPEEAEEEQADVEVVLEDDVADEQTETLSSLASD